MGATSIGLFVGGGVLELAGIILVGSPDLFPWARRLSAGLRRQGGALEARFLALIGRRRDVAVHAGVASAVALGGRVSLLKAPGEAATLEEKVDFLVRRDKEAQDRENALGHKIEDLEAELDQRVSTLRDEMEEHVADALRAAHEYHLPLRRLGVVLLIVGLGCATAGNFG